MNQIPELQRPTAETYVVEDVLQNVKRGRLRIPEWQRTWKWDDADVRKLFDSIYRGYPIGNLLFWERATTVSETVTFGDFVIFADPRTDAWSVIDGQQRIRSLASVLLRPQEQSAPTKYPWFELYFDLESGQFVHRAKGNTGEIPGSWLPLNVISDTIDLLDWLGRYRGPKEHKSVASAVAKAVREYRIPVYIVKTDDERIVKVIFERMNNTAKALKDSEVFKARSPSGSTDRLKRVFDQLGFGVPGDDVIVKLPLGMMGKDITGRASKGLDIQDDVEGAITRVVRVLPSIISLLRDVAGIPHVDLLPYRVPLHILARFFGLYPAPSEDSRRKLAAWVWRGAALGTYQGSYVTLARRSVTKMPTGDEMAAVEHLWQEQAGQSMPIVTVTRWDFRAARTKIGALALVRRRPLDLRSGEPLDAPALLSALGSSAFPQVVRNASGGADSDQLQGLGNRVLHSVESGESVLGLLKNIPSPDERTRSHWIPDDALSLLHKSDYCGFLKLRDEALQAEVQRLVELEGAWGPSEE